MEESWGGIGDAVFEGGSWLQAAKSRFRMERAAVFARLRREEPGGRALRSKEALGASSELRRKWEEGSSGVMERLQSLSEYERTMKQYDSGKRIVRGTSCGESSPPSPLEVPAHRKWGQPSPNHMIREAEHPSLQEFGES